MSSPAVALCGSPFARLEQGGDGWCLAAQAIRPLNGRGCQVVSMTPWSEFLIRPAGRYAHLNPLQFVHKVYESPLGLGLDDIVCSQVVDWLKRQPQPCRASINIHPGSLARPEFADMLLAELRAAGISGERICLELVEYGRMEAPEKLRPVVEKLQAAGVKLAIDDYGRGAPCFEVYGAGFIDYIKIDRSYIRDICANPGHLALVNGILSLAKAVNAEIIAEGVEYQAQAELLANIGVHWGQGYLFERPRLVD